MKKIELLPEVLDFHSDDDDRLEKKIQKSVLTALKKIPHSQFKKIAQGAYSSDGISDILGCYKGRFIAMEVKRAKEKPTPLQTIYLNDVVRAGGIASVVRSVKDAMKTIEKALTNFSSHDIISNSQ